MLAAAPVSRVRPAARCGVVTRASGATSGAGDIKPGQKVKVKTPIAVYHGPKSKGAATQLQGLQGVVTALADIHTDGTQLSCTMPLKARTLARTPAPRHPARSPAYCATRLSCL